MNNSQLAHTWAQGNNKSAKGSNFSCENNNLYSYYTIIGFIEKDIAFLSTDSMTPSTSKHISYARRAINGGVFYTPVFKYGNHYRPTVKEAILAAIDSLTVDYSALDKALTRLPWLLSSFDTNRENIIKIAKKFKVKTGKLPVISDALREKSKLTIEKIEQREYEREEKNKIALEQRQALDKADFDLWLTTGKGRCPNSYNFGKFAYITLFNDTVKTSQGAEAPLEHVKKAVAFYLSRKSEGGFLPYHTNGHKVPLGNFALDEILSNGNVKAGCHLFEASEISRFISAFNLA